MAEEPQAEELREQPLFVSDDGKIRCWPQYAEAHRIMEPVPGSRVELAPGIFEPRPRVWTRLRLSDPVRQGILRLIEERDQARALVEQIEEMARSIGSLQGANLWSAAHRAAQSWRRNQREGG